MNFKNLYEDMDKTPTYGEHSGEQTEETKIIGTLSNKIPEFAGQTSETNHFNHKLITS